MLARLEIGRASCRERVYAAVSGVAAKEDNSKLGHAQGYFIVKVDGGHQWQLYPLPNPAFFFSSRRRHTRWTGDWSSDVCSSDLATGGGCGRGLRPRRGGWRFPSDVPGRAPAACWRGWRSEERRVGKECMPRCPGLLRKKTTQSSATRKAIL